MYRVTPAAFASLFCRTHRSDACDCGLFGRRRCIEPDADAVVRRDDDRSSIRGSDDERVCILARRHDVERADRIA